jgi:hypothetical protein
MTARALRQEAVGNTKVAPQFTSIHCTKAVVSETPWFGVRLLRPRICNIPEKSSAQKKIIKAIDMEN